MSFESAISSLSRSEWFRVTSKVKGVNCQVGIHLFRLWASRFIQRIHASSSFAERLWTFLTGNDIGQSCDRAFYDRRNLFAHTTGAKALCHAESLFHGAYGKVPIVFRRPRLDPIQSTRRVGNLVLLDDFLTA